MPMTAEGMADRLVNYADAMAAFAVAAITHRFGWLFVITAAVIFVFALWLAFGRYGQVKLGLPEDVPEVEIRCSLASRAGLVYTGVVVQGLVLCTAILACHRTEGRMRRQVAPIAPDLQKLRVIFLAARLAITLFATVGVIPLMNLALFRSLGLLPR